MNERGRGTRHKGGFGSDPRSHADFIWLVADLLRGDYKQSEYEKVILPLIVLRRLDGVLAPTKQQVLEKHKQLQGRLAGAEQIHKERLRQLVRVRQEDHYR